MIQVIRILTMNLYDFFPRITKIKTRIPQIGFNYNKNPKKFIYVIVHNHGKDWK
jgi:hypothetical protein